MKRIDDADGEGATHCCLHQPTAAPTVCVTNTSLINCWKRNALSQRYIVTIYGMRSTVCAYSKWLQNASMMLLGKGTHCRKTFIVTIYGMRSAVCIPDMRSWSIDDATVGVLS
jgi:hypothetical protein